MTTLLKERPRLKAASETETTFENTSIKAVEVPKTNGFNLIKLLGAAATVGLGTIALTSLWEEPKEEKEEDDIDDRYLEHLIEEAKVNLVPFTLSIKSPIPTTKKQALAINEPQSLIGGRNINKLRFHFAMPNTYLDVGVVEDLLELSIHHKEQFVLVKNIANITDLEDDIHLMLDHLELCSLFDSDAIVSYIVKQLSELLPLRHLQILNLVDYSLPFKNLNITKLSNAKHDLIRDIDMDVWEISDTSTKRYIAIFPVVDPEDSIGFISSTEFSDIENLNNVLIFSKINTLVSALSANPYHNNLELYKALYDSMNYNLKHFIVSL